MRKYIVRTAAATTALLALSLACQPLPGDYRIYKITSLPEQLDAGCFPPDGVDPNAGDTTTFFGASTVALFATDADTYFLEFGPYVITGTRDGGDYTFSGDSLDVQEITDDANTRTTVNVDINVTIKNKEISGSYTVVTATTCEGDSAVCDAIENTTCIRTNTFFGAEIDDVELEYGVGGGGVGP